LASHAPATATCKAHTTKALDSLIEDLKAEREEWAGAQEECRRGAEQLCLLIQADAYAKIQSISNESAALQQQVHAPAPKFNNDILYQSLHWCRYELPPKSAQPPSALLRRSGRSLWPALLPLPRLQWKARPPQPLSSVRWTGRRGASPPHQQPSSCLLLLLLLLLQQLSATSSLHPQSSTLKTPPPTPPLLKLLQPLPCPSGHYCPSCVQKPTLKRVVFLQNTLPKYRPLLEPSEGNGNLQAVATGHDARSPEAGRA
jgi:hypothetical protein